MSDTTFAQPSTAREAPTLRNYVAGGWRAATTGDSLKDRNPATGEVIGRIPLSGHLDVAAAVEAARAALPRWRATSPMNRARALFRLRDVLDAHRD